jgi:hypothetical protein
MAEPHVLALMGHHGAHHASDVASLSCSVLIAAFPVAAAWPFMKKLEAFYASVANPVAATLWCHTYRPLPGAISKQSTSGNRK